MRARAGAFGFIALVAAASCSIGEVDLTGKHCPCAPGFVCDRSTNVCLGSLDASAPPDASLDDGPDDATPSGAIALSNLHAMWATPNSVRWEWSAQGNTTLFGSYELVVGPTPEAVKARAAGVRVWTSDDNPELGAFQVVDVNLDVEQVTRTATDKHTPATTYFAQLVAIDASGKRSTSNVAQAQTADTPSHELVIFSEADMAGSSMPPAFARSMVAPFAGTFDYGGLVSCSGTPPSCLENFRRVALGVSLAALPQSSFDVAFLELAVSGSARTEENWSIAGLYFGDDTCGGASSDAACKWHYDGWSMRAGQRYRVLQVPLRTLHRLGQTATLTYAELVAQGFKLYAVNVFGRWVNGTTTRVDEIRVRW
jgi:hypothetical protein